MFLENDGCPLSHTFEVSKNSGPYQNGISAFSSQNLGHASKQCRKHYDALWARRIILILELKTFATSLGLELVHDKPKVQ